MTRGTERAVPRTGVGEPVEWLAEARVRLARRTRVTDGGRVLRGGTPMRVMRLSAAGRQVLAGRTVRTDSPTGRALAGRLLAIDAAYPVMPAQPVPRLSELTVVIPVFGRAERLARALDSLPAELAGRIVVDDGTADAADATRLREIAQARGATLIRRPVNGGPGAARNTGLAAVRTRFVAFVDSDVVLEPGTLTALLRHAADPGLGVVAPRVRGLGDAAGSGTWLGRYEASSSSLDLGPEPGLVRLGGYLGWLPAACLLARTEALGSGFAPELRFGEDVDLVWRLVDTGWRARYDPSVIVRHAHRTRFVPWLVRKFRYGTSAQPLSRRHPGRAAPARFPRWGVLVPLFLLLDRRWSLAFGGGLLVSVFGRLRYQVRTLPRPTRTAGVLTTLSVAAVLRQWAGLLLRHWWPVTVLGALASRRMRRVALAVALGDALRAWGRSGTRLDPLRFGVARRLDDLAYGTGVWWGALRAGRWGSLRPVIVRRARAGE